MPAVTPQTVINGEISILTSLDLFSRLVNKMGAVNIYPELSNMSKGSITAENAAIRILKERYKSKEYSKFKLDRGFIYS